MVVISVQCFYIIIEIKIWLHDETENPDVNKVSLAK